MHNKVCKSVIVSHLQLFLIISILCLTRIVSEKDLTSHLTDRTCETIEATMDEVVKNKVENDEDIVICEILRDFARTTKPPYSLSDIKDGVSSRRQSKIKKINPNCVKCISLKS